ncbi:putative endonuclease/Exonuclease/phosphatase family protein [Lyophyllum shimeji]|uniref:Endonuclease/Exonuclease/phosphatase family protein n=1 Tax=Lyophyllum shimeji TaxID=47721 RepID=A0A9P3PNI3_LYOSH|nr:putative endonuclease/Exonuclease/phosphatase family protein [Lyophyllum shimeji]
MFTELSNAVILLQILAIAVHSAAAMRIVTYNLRFDSQPDNITVQESLNSLLDPLQQPAFLTLTKEDYHSEWGFQEALVRQVNDLAELFGPEWSWIGVGRDDGVAAGEFSPIFFKNDVKLISKDFFWLSNTPFEPSKFPGAGSIRICTAAFFSTSVGGTQKNFTLLNTHLDDQSDAQRRLGASMLLVRARFEAVRTGTPVFITGDFNSPSTGPDSGAYNIITGAAPPVAINATFADKYAVKPDQLPDFKMLDLRGQAPRRNVSANFATFTGFSAPNDTSSWARIDFMFGGNNKGWTAEGQKAATSLSDDGVLASDHRPVFTDVSI